MRPSLLARKFGSMNPTPRRLASIPAKALVARYETFGDPHKVLNIREEILLPPATGEVTIKILFSPVNPSDINTVEGVYGHKPKLPAVAGGEMVAKVIAVGSGVTHVKEGDIVLPSHLNVGAWRTYATVKGSDLFSVPSLSGVKLEDLAPISVNPPSALRMLEDYVQLKPGDVVVQNGANSMVGLSVMQIAAARGIKTVNIIRKGRANYEELVAKMKTYGGDHIVDDEHARTPEFRATLAQLGKPKLALNCIGGDSATTMARWLTNGGTMVTYGGMSLKPVTIPTGAFIFNDINLKGFWLPKWTERAGIEAHKKMIITLMELVSAGKLHLMTETHSFQPGLLKAVERAQQSTARDKKVLLKLDE